MLINLRAISRSLCMSFLLVSSIALADDFENGKALYKQGKFAEAATKLEAASKENPKDARVWWQLNFAYHKLHREADSLNAIRKAGELDPAHKFASDPSKYAATLADRQSQAGASSRTAVRTSNGGSTSSSPVISGDNASGGITRRLLDGDVYAEPGINIDAAHLQSVANSLKPVTVKFVIFNSTSNSATLDREASRIRDYLNISRGYVICSSRRAVAVSSSQLDRNRLKTLVKQVAPSMESGRYTDGLETLAKGLVETRSKQTAQSNFLWVIVLGGLALVVVLWMISSAVKKSRLAAERKQPLERLKSDVVAQLSFLDDNVALLDPATASRVKELRINAGSRLDEASRLLRTANSERDFNSVQNLLDHAMADIQRGRSLAESALSGKPVAATAAAVGASAMGSGPSGTPDFSNMAANEKGVCFFCSMPSRLSDLTPVTVNLQGQQQKVLACSADLNTIRTGQMPQIRAFQQNGQYVPWYAYNDYDPYRDYYSRGYNNSSLVADLVTLSIIDHMYWDWHRPHGWGWGGYGYGNSYVFYTDHDNYRDYYSNYAASGMDYNRGPSDAAGADFLGSSGGDDFNRYDRDHS